MNVSLTPELEQLVHEKVKSGRYLSASEVVREALRLLEERDRIREARLITLRSEIAVGIEQGDRGEVIDGEEVFRELREDIRQISKGKRE
ncbi:MAG: type II toxin-antitoxin system ParD family antitoxin [Cyanomargarita calcarea GSE-NOS-MK-12-04C]|jgi:antitoxin ParD1/3/4|uniref:Type II toxin-antitoxin system ParD family antitoxin n=1 Tax=Cyanomargarita calcarea GSE-NOS-MK-12-04C TaxID=2839659 RepID=A0A951UQN7_9CYAN|nr:type II toxin-antitoxin system ParD family antitoxin [Cyanomargarita calcarea GSE-NOS-MK-12-04C]